MQLPVYHAQQAYLSSATITAMTISDAIAITTSQARGECLLADGYTLKIVDPNRKIVEAKGQPTTHKRRLTGEIYVDPHGPYSINLEAETCTCPAFANREACPHIAPAQSFFEAWKRGESAPVHRVEIAKGLVVLREIGGDRLMAREGYLLAFRSFDLAAAHWESRGYQSTTEIVALAKDEAQTVLKSGRYRGLLHVLRSGESYIAFGAGAVMADVRTSVAAKTAPRERRPSAPAHHLVSDDEADVPLKPTPAPKWRGDIDPEDVDAKINALRLGRAALQFANGKDF